MGGSACETLRNRPCGRDCRSAALGKTRAQPRWTGPTHTAKELGGGDREVGPTGTASLQMGDLGREGAWLLGGGAELTP